MQSPEELIDVLHMEDLRNESHPAIFDRNPGYDMLIVRLPEIGRVLEVRSVGFVLTHETAYFYDRERSRFEMFDDRFEGPHRMVDAMTDRLMKGFMRYQERIADMEDTLYGDRASEGFMTRWLEYKRDILRIERVLMRSSEAIKGVIEAYEELESFPVNHYADIFEHMERIMRNATLQLSKLDYLYNFYNVRTSEKMNRMIYLLTIISAVFLPLNLVVGFFGMNTGGLPFSEGSGGTIYAVLLMVSLMALTSGIVYFWRRKVEK